MEKMTGDDSDEQCELIKSLPSSYRPTRPPKEETPLNTSLRIVSIDDVDVDLGKIQVLMQIQTTWEDGRITLIQMSHESEDNLVDKNVWTPKYYFANGVFEDNVNYINKKNVIERTIANRNTGGKMGVINSYEGYEYNGESNASITHIESVLSSFDCDFDLLYYPFDIHTCEIQIQLKQIGGHKAHFDTRTIYIYPDNFTLSEFTTEPVCYTFVNQSANHANLVKIHILLSRRYGAYILTTFLPCLVLTIIGALTEFFEDDNFSDRINVTLAALIVIASLISQVATTAPVSAQPKLIDMYFCFCMFRLFFCFVHHGLLCMVRCFMVHREEKSKHQTTNVPKQTTNIQDSLLSLRDLDVPAAASYVPPPKNLVVSAWQLQLAVPPPSCESTVTTSEGIAATSLWRQSTTYKIVNGASIFVGFLVDAITYAVIVVFVINNYYRALEDYKENCQN
ncbi:gamma-aminobutyric acid receptor subunit pi-like isoform X1 [Macrobrachium nipponense]|uniref:gamma-aminobutyric acid receptor subunit pi-like isoform X1 n=1 Tax=Macrobrachium nipponense TaxID=159736 RepID=UPI0030C7DFDE